MVVKVRSPAWEVLGAWEWSAVAQEAQREEVRAGGMLWMEYWVLMRMWEVRL